MKRRIIWTEEMLNYIREHYYNEPANDIADVLSISAPTIIKKAKELGLEKNPSFKPQNYCGRFTRERWYANC